LIVIQIRIFLIQIILILIALIIIKIKIFIILLGALQTPRLGVSRPRFASLHMMHGSADS
jgi:hypothetical protein